MRWLVWSLLPMLALAGCLDDEQGDPITEDEETPTVGGNTTVPEVRDLPPQVTLSVSVAQGEAPLNVTINFTATDEELNLTVWQLDVDGDGSPERDGTGDQLPGTHNVSYEEAGNYTINFTVSDATNTTVASAVVVVQTPPAPPVPGPIVITGSAVVPNPANSAQCLRDGIDGDVHDLERSVNDWDFQVTEGFVVYWFGPGGYISGGDASGTVPAGATQAEVCSATEAQAEYILTIAHPDYTGEA